MRWILELSVPMSVIFDELLLRQAVGRSQPAIAADRLADKNTNSGNKYRGASIGLCPRKTPAEPVLVSTWSSQESV